jgi:hypothetical protein
MRQLEKGRDIDGLFQSAFPARWNHLVLSADPVMFEPVFLVSRVWQEHFDRHETAGPLGDHPPEPKPDTAPVLARFYFLQ